VSEIPHVVIVGAGFGGLRAARALRRAPLRVTLVDRRNYHLFQPLLYQVATAGLSPEDIAHPVRAIFRRQRNFAFRLAEVLRVDLPGRVLHTSTGELPFDWLILAPGGTNNFFGLDSVEANGLPLKDIEDAVAVRNQVLRMFETAVQEPDADRRRAMLNFVVVGGGRRGRERGRALRADPAGAHQGLPGPEREGRPRDPAGGRPAARRDARALREVTAEILWRKHVEVRFGAR
jgi:NADH dehydrogenase